MPPCEVAGAAQVERARWDICRHSNDLSALDRDMRAAIGCRHRSSRFHYGARKVIAQSFWIRHFFAAPIRQASAPACGGTMEISRPGRPESSSLVSIQALRAIAALLVFWGHAILTLNHGETAEFPPSLRPLRSRSFLCHFWIRHGVLLRASVRTARRSDQVLR